MGNKQTKKTSNRLDTVSKVIHNEIAKSAGSQQANLDYAPAKPRYPDTITSISSNLTLPLSIAGLSLGAFLLFSKR